MEPHKSHLLAWILLEVKGLVPKQQLPSLDGKRRDEVALDDFGEAVSGKKASTSDVVDRPRLGVRPRQVLDGVCTLLHRR